VGRREHRWGIGHEGSSGLVGGRYSKAQTRWTAGKACVWGKGPQVERERALWEARGYPRAARALARGALGATRVAVDFCRLSVGV